MLSAVKTYGLVTAKLKHHFLSSDFETKEVSFSHFYCFEVFKTSYCFSCVDSACDELSDDVYRVRLNVEFHFHFTMVWPD